MIAGRRIWLAALILCVLGVLGCVGLGLWLAGAAWQAPNRAHDLRIRDIGFQNDAVVGVRNEHIRNRQGGNQKGENPRC